MAQYLAGRIHKGKLMYDAVVIRYPQLQAEIDAILEGQA